MKPRELLIALSVKYDNDWDKMFNAIRKREQFTEEQTKSLCDKVKDKKIITILDENYPESLKYPKENKLCSKPPLVIYC